MLNPTMLCDFYKVGHKDQYPKGTEKIYSTWTARGSRIEGIEATVFFGLQGFIHEYLIDYFNKYFFDRCLSTILLENREAIEGGLGIMNPDLSHIEALHRLGYLPLEICALPEGTSVPVRVPSFTVTNTLPEFFWLVNALETLISTEMWSCITTSTIAKEYRRILDSYAIETTGSTEGVDYQAHDFSMRGMNGVSHAAKAGSGHLLSFLGTDCIPSLFYLKKYYKGDINNAGIGCSIPATEHSVQCANMPEDEDETETIKRMITEVYPTGLVSMVLDTNDFWRNMTEALPRLEETIMKRDGKLVVRPDSGDPADIICGTLKNIRDFSKNAKNIDELKEYVEEEILAENIYNISLEPGECGPDKCSTRIFWLGDYYDVTMGNIEWNRHDKTYYYHDQWSDYTWDIKKVDIKPEHKGLIEILFEEFGGTINEQGYKVLDPHIGAIYGDSITLDRAKDICQRLKDKGFASTNIVLGVGSYSYAYHTRDTFGMAFKSTYAVINGKEVFLSKNPKTDSGLKKSQRGMVAVFESNGKLGYFDGLSQKDIRNFHNNLMKPVFKDGIMLKFDSLKEIKRRVKGE